jgi:hypothetical protein
MLTPAAPSVRAAASPRPVGDAARGDDRHRADGVDDLRHQRQRGHRAAVPAGLATLGDDDVDAARRRLARLRDRSDLVHHETAGVVRAVHQVAGVVERERDHCWCGLQREIEAGVVEVGNDVVDREGPVCCVADRRDTSFELVGRPLPRAKTSQTALVRDGRDELGRREDAHAGLDDRRIDTHAVTKRRTQHQRLRSCSRVG